MAAKRKPKVKPARIYDVELYQDSRPFGFVHSLPTVIEHHMGVTPKMFRPASLQRDFRLEWNVYVTRQAINSALQALLKKERIDRVARGLYCHVLHL